MVWSKQPSIIFITPSGPLHGNYALTNEGQLFALLLPARRLANVFGLSPRRVEQYDLRAIHR